MRFGQGDHQYELVEGWGQLPEGWRFAEVAAVAVDSQDHVYAFHRGERPVIVFDREGAVVDHWGDELVEAHGMFIDANDNIFLVDRGAHTIEKYAPDGRHLVTFGARGEAASAFSNRPMNMPQGVASGPSGDVYVADGKSNNAVHRYDAAGAYLGSWGGAGTGPGEFNEPHGAWVLPDGRVMIADRGNDRIQVFSPDGRYLSEWAAGVIHHPDHVYIDAEGVVYVTEIDFHRISILSPAGQLLARWGVQGAPRGDMADRWEGSAAPGLFRGPHGIWADSRGDLYVSEVGAGRRVQKFARVRNPDGGEGRDGD